MQWDASQIVAVLGGAATAIGGLVALWRFVLAPLLTFIKKLKNYSERMSDALPVLLDIYERFSLGRSLPDAFDYLRTWKNVLLESRELLAFEADAKGHCNWVNHRWQTLTGLTYNDSLDDGWRVIIADSDRVKVTQAWERAVDEGSLFDATFDIVDQKGQLVHVRGRGEVVRTLDRKLIGYVTVLRVVKTNP